MGCRMCGQCYNKIHLHPDLTREILEDVYDNESHNFIRENWEYLGSSKDLEGFEVTNKYGVHHFGVFQCKLVTEDNLCSIHENKPSVCSGYPWYSNYYPRDVDRNVPWPYVGCGYEKIYHVFKLIEVTRKLRDSMLPIICKDKTNGNCRRKMEMNGITYK